MFQQLTKYKKHRALHGFRQAVTLNKLLAPLTGN